MSGQRGFTLLEVMIAVLVVAVGLLGLAKTQALATSNTQIASVRSLLAFQASSLAAAMHGNRAFWASGSSDIFTRISGTTVTDAANVLNAPPANGCITAACSPAQLAAYDIKVWAGNLDTQFPGTSATINCPKASPVACVVKVTWSEKYIALKAATAASAVTTSQNLSLQVVP